MESSGFESFGGGKYGLFLSLKVDGKMTFTDYWKVLALIFLEMGNTVFCAMTMVDQDFFMNMVPDMYICQIRKNE